MGLIGLGTVTAIGLILGVRSKQTLNKLMVLLMWGFMAVVTAGFV